MIISVITVCKNSASTISSTIESVNFQSYPRIQHVFVVGSSSDSTLSIIHNSASRSPLILTGHDNGIYDAMNKGFEACDGEVVCFLNSDDRFSSSDVLLEVANAFNTHRCDYICAQVCMLDKHGCLSRVMSGAPSTFGPLFHKQIPHPGFFATRKMLASLTPVFDASYFISADLKQQLMLFSSSQWIGARLHTPVVLMASGGASSSSIAAYILGWRESRRAFNEVFGAFGLFYVVYKILSKISGLSPWFIIRRLRQWPRHS